MDITDICSLMDNNSVTNVDRYKELKEFGKKLSICQQNKYGDDNFLNKVLYLFLFYKINLIDDPTMYNDITDPERNLHWNYSKELIIKTINTDFKKNRLLFIDLAYSALVHLYLSLQDSDSGIVTTDITGRVNDITVNDNDISNIMKYCNI